MQPNNILSYFIKDIKDPLELNKYRYYNISRYFIEILYNEKLIYYHNINCNYIYNYITNICKAPYLKDIYTAKIRFSKNFKHKSLFYKEDNTINNISSNLINYEYIYNKYGNMCKQNFAYRINNKCILIIKIKYYNGSKYMYYNYKYKSKSGISAYKSQILIMNKYELQYIKRFFNLYFAHFYFGDFT